jgi:hypothetical protein
MLDFAAFLTDAGENYPNGGLGLGVRPGSRLSRGSGNQNDEKASGIQVGEKADNLKVKGQESRGIAEIWCKWVPLPSAI